MPLARHYHADSAAQDALVRLSKLQHIVGVGVEKSGSSTLHDLLALSPAVTVAVNKETAFFNEHLEKGPQWYARQYRFTGRETAFLDFTPGYFRDVEVLEAIRDFPTNKRIILMVRNPVKRAFSFYHHDIRQHLCKGETVRRRQKTWQIFETPELAFSFENMWQLRVPYYFGLLATRLKTIYQLFGASSVRLVPLEGLVSDPLYWIENLEEFLDLDLAAAKNTVLPHANPGSLPVFEKKRQGNGQPIALFLTDEGQERRIFAPDETAMDAALDLQAGWTKQLDPTLANEIYSSHFRPDVDRVTELSGLDLSAWERELSV